MSDLKMNSVLGAGIAAVLGVMLVGVGAETLIHPNYPEEAAYLPEVVIEGPTTAGPVGPPDFGRLFSDAAGLAELVARGERVHAQCVSCHTFEAGGANGIGPNLHDAFGRAVASHGGYTYSEAMAGHGGSWDYMALNDFLTSPASNIRGTKMAFAGIRNEQDRVAVIAYLRSISPNNVPLPAAFPEAAPAAAEGDAAATTEEAATTPAAPAPASSGGGH